MKQLNWRGDHGSYHAHAGAFGLSIRWTGGAWELEWPLPRRTLDAAELTQATREAEAVLRLHLREALEALQ